MAGGIAGEPVDARIRKIYAAFGRYSDMARRGGWPVIPGGGEVVLDGTDPRAVVLRERLIAEVYLAADESDIGSIGLSGGVRRVPRVTSSRIPSCRT